MGRPRCAGSTASAVTARGRADARHDLLTRLGSNLRFSSGRECSWRIQGLPPEFLSLGGAG